MAENKKEITRYQELYLRYIFLFGKGVPLTIKAAINKLMEQRRLSLTYILTGKKDYIRTSNNALYKLLFEDSNKNIYAQIDSWTITTLCEVAFVLTEESNVSYMGFKVILDQRQDLDNYAKVASLNYLLFQLKSKVLSKYLLKLSKNTFAEYECKRLLLTFDESEAIRIGCEVYDSLKLTGDVDKHVKVITDYVLPSHIKARPEKETVTSKYKEKQVVQIIQMLTDKIVHSGDTVTLDCELNKDGCHVCWLKDGEKLTKTRNVYIFAESGSHFLIVSKVTPEDSGTYTCTYKDMSTSASLLVTEQDVLIQIPLHNVYDGKIREYMKVELSCTANLLSMTPRWFQNNREIKENNAKVTILSEGYEYKLIIHHVELSDNGEYKIVFDGVTSKVSITVTGYTQLAVKEDYTHLTVKQQIKHNLYQNWVKGVLGLKYLRLGLESPASQAVKSHHEKMLKDLPEELKADGKCSECNAENLLPLHLKTRCPRIQNKHKCPCFKSSHIRRHCPSNGLCSEVYDIIVRDHRFEDPAMRNIRMDLWKTDPWSVAACYMSSTDYTHTSAYKFKQSSKELDC